MGSNYGTEQFSWQWGALSSTKMPYQILNNRESSQMQAVAQTRMMLSIFQECKCITVEQNVTISSGQYTGISIKIKPNTLRNIQKR